MRKFVGLILGSALLAGAAPAATGLATPEAQADVRVRVGGHVRVGGGVRVRRSGPAIRWWPRSYYYYQPAPTVIYAPQPEYQPQPVYGYAGPSSYQPAPVTPSRKLSPFQLGIYAGAGSEAIVDYAGSERSYTEQGITGQLRVSRHLLIEGTLKRLRYDDFNDDKSGGSLGLIGDLLPSSVVSPYLALAVGTQGNDNSSDTFAEVGGGLRLDLGSTISLYGELRGGSLVANESDETVRTQQYDFHAQDREFARASLGALIRF